MEAKRESWRFALIDILRQRDGEFCGVCGGALLGRIQIDHILPVSEGGVTRIDNLRLAHPSCNNARPIVLEQSPVVSYRDEMSRLKEKLISEAMLACGG